MNQESDNITIFTDGASRGNPGPAGWGAVIIFNENKKVMEVQEIGGREENSADTNNRMEITAAIKALEFFSRSTFYVLRSTIFSDSSYLINGITKWVYGWQKNNWKTIEKKPVENRDLWERLIEVSKGKEIKWKYTGGHIGVAGNERADQIAADFADGKKPKLFKGHFSDYPFGGVLDLSFDTSKLNKKNTSLSRNRKRAYSYVSLVGGIVQVHETWAECKERVIRRGGVLFRKALNAVEEKEIAENFKSIAKK